MVIIGASLAGAKGAEALRREGYDGPIVLLGQEPERPYERPDLSKDYLAGASDKEKIYVHPKQWYAENDVELRLSTRATGIDREARLVHLERAEPIGYEKLLIATGASPRLLPIPRADRHREYYLRRIEDSQQLKFILQSAPRVVVIGGGWIGLETAAAARAAGAEVTMLVRGDLPLLSVLGPEVAPVFAELHRGHGVDLRCGVQVAEVTGEGRKVSGVRLTDGTWIAADVVIAGVGATPNTALATTAGLAVDDGISVDEHLRSSDPHIFAAGDVANAYHPVLGRQLRVGHWASARYQPAVAAKSMLGIEAVYDRLPYFFTDQYDLGMEYFGSAAPGEYDQVAIRGDLHAREFVAFWLKNGVVQAGMQVNVPAEAAQVRALVASRKRVDPEKLADTDVVLSDVHGPEMGPMGPL